MPEAQETVLPLHQCDEPLLRPNQIEEATEELGRLNALFAPTADREVTSQVADKTDAARQARACTKQLAKYTPKPYGAGTELDRAISEEARLADSIRARMPTRDEMMKTPVGAVDKHRIWESKKKADIARWKNVRLRLHASGACGELDDPSDIANVEILRPVSKAQELDMGDAVIGGHTLYGIPPVVEAKNVMEPERATELADETRDLLVKLAAMGDTASQRRCTELGLVYLSAAVKPKVKATRKKRGPSPLKGVKLSPERAEANRANLGKAAVAKKAKQEARDLGVEV